ncbi:RecB family exonuclease [Streptomyces antarcticus]|uniref:RecB family exonuclease n=1 Tax=Streptomyces antarcticus TaxID=2996458 RepID=UPI00226D8A0E|nr:MULTISPECIES: PD-(D/E)XK nuclease family protein [unclassified Streptomyces]MCY0941898.1 PD-(D/E)XK nuclease family protein [Streptomyces sp. H34-AA3]MCZ4082829.1 PD-(D/E)XK nuclease family protein [Streptomyces sp. H34-S5]
MTNRRAAVQSMTRSVSQLEQYEKCPKQYELQRVERIIPRPAAWSHQGSAFHTAAEVHEGEGRKLTADQVVNVFHVEYLAGIKRDLVEEPNLDHWMTAGTDGQSDIEARYVLGVEQTRAYVRWAEQNEPVIWKDSAGQPGIEIHLTAELGGVRVQGYVDQFIGKPDGSVRVRDLKTGSMKSKFQLQTYGVLARKVLGVEVNDADWYMAKSGGLSRPVDLRDVAEDAVAERFVRMDQGVKAGDFPAKPGFLCRFCDVGYACSSRRG